MKKRKNEKFRGVRLCLAHITLALGAMLITFFIIDRFNDAMEFMTSDLSKWVILVLAVLAFVSSILNIVALWKNPDRNKKQEDK